MSEKRKRIFKEALFIVPFMLIVTAVSLAMMFFVGRTPRDMMGILSRNFTSDKSMKLSDYAEYNNKKYTLEYYYGDSEECVKFAEFSYNSRGDDTIYELTLLEPRDGFDPGNYTIEWFYSEEYVTYSPLGGTEETELNLVEDVPITYNMIKSYSWKSQMEAYEADSEMFKGYKVIGLVSVFTWDSPDRQNIVWGLGGNPKQLYSYLNTSKSEYKKVVYK